MKKYVLTKILNDYYINDKQVHYKDFNKLFYDLTNYKQIDFTNYIDKGQLVNKWTLQTV